MAIHTHPPARTDAGSSDEGAAERRERGAGTLFEGQSAEQLRLTHMVATAIIAGERFLPVAKRTVEGDLGIRYNARSILKLCGQDQIMKNACLPHSELSHKLESLSHNVDFLPQSPQDLDLDFALASCAAKAAMERHAGNIETLWGPQGQFYLQYGKDLTGFGYLIGTGGIFIHHPQAGEILRKTLFSPEEPFSLRPRDPAIYTDARYCLFAIGLLADTYPEQACRIARKYLKKWN